MVGIFLSGCYTYNRYYDNGNIQSSSKKIFPLQTAYNSKQYYENGTIKREVFQNPLFFYNKGYVKNYYENGELQSYSKLINHWEGYGKNYYKNGNIESEGVSKVPESMREMKSGYSILKKGVWKYYDENGQFIREEDHGEVE